MNQNKQTQKNFIFNLINLTVNLSIGLFYTPYLVRSLGIIAYGIVPLALIINQYINVITGSLTGSLTRFYSIALQNKKNFDASKYLSSSFVAISAIAFLISPIFILIVVKIDTVFNIPPQHVHETRILFSFTFLSFIFSLYSSLFNVSLYALNRLDLLNIINTIRVGIKVTLTVAFFEAISKGISYIGYANFLTELLTFFVSFYFFKINTDKDIKVSFKFFQKAALFSVLTMTTWVIIHQLGDTGLYKIDNILVNRFWNTRESGILGALSDFGTYVMTFVLVISSLFGPLILIAYSNGDHEQVKRLALRNSLFVGIITALIVGLLIAFAKPIISLWLGSQYAAYSKWFILKQITLPFYAAAGVFAFVFRAWNKVIIPALVTLVIGILNLGVSTYICYLGKGNENFIFYMLIASVIFILCQSYWLNAFSFYKLYPELPKKGILYGFLQISLILFTTSFLGTIYLYYFPVINIIQLLIGFSINSLVSATFAFLIIFNQTEKILIVSYLRGVGKYIKK